MPGIFVSYAHRDNQPVTDATEGWVTHFHRHLSAELCRRQNGRQLAFEKQLADADVLLILFSSAWLASEGCLHEFKAFCDSHADFGRRIFVLEISRIEAGDKPIIMQDLPAYPFWWQTGTGNGKQSGHPLPDSGDSDYFSLLVDLSHDLVHTLKCLRSCPEEQAVSSATVYVAPVHDALYRKRRRLVSELQQFGITVMPRNNRLDGRVDDELAQCSHFVQLLDEEWAWGVPFNLYLAAEYSGKPVLQWRDPWRDYGSRELPDEHRFLLTGKSVQLTPLADFIRTVCETVLPDAAGARLTLDDALADRVERIVNSDGAVESPPSPLHYTIAEMQPGKQPFAQLAEALLANREFAASWKLPLVLPMQQGKKAAETVADNHHVDILVAELSRGSRSLHEILARSPLPAGTKLLLLISQFDGVFQCRKQDRDQVAAFVALLREASIHPDIYVLVSARAGAPGSRAEFRDLSRLIKQGMYSTSRLWSSNTTNTPTARNGSEQAETLPEEPLAGRNKWHQLSFVAMGFLAIAGLAWWVFPASQQEEQAGLTSPVSLEDATLPASKPSVESMPLIETESKVEVVLPAIAKPKTEAVPLVEVEPEINVQSEPDPEIEATERQLRKAVDSNPQDVNAITELAIFMRDVRQDNDRAAKLFRQAIKLDPKDVNIRDSYAIFLQLNRHDYAEAEKQYRKVLKGMPENANTLANYAQVLLAQGKLDEGRKQLDAAFQHYSTDYPQSLLLELWFYRFAHFPDDYPKAQAEITKLLEKGERDEGWNFSGNIIQAGNNGHPDMALLNALVEVISNNAGFETLDVYLKQ